MTFDYLDSQTLYYLDGQLIGTEFNPWLPWGTGVSLLGVFQSAPNQLNPGAYSLYFDNVKVQSAGAPEPSALALLGLGGVGLAPRPLARASGRSRRRTASPGQTSPKRQRSSRKPEAPARGKSSLTGASGSGAPHSGASPAGWRRWRRWRRVKRWGRETLAAVDPLGASAADSWAGAWVRLAL
jgi:hypothetical protein